MTVTGIDHKVVDAGLHHWCATWRKPSQLRQDPGVYAARDAHYAHAQDVEAPIRQPTDARAKFTGLISGRSIEIMQPLDPQSSWHDYLESMGSIHHIAFFVPDNDAPPNPS